MADIDYAKLNRQQKLAIFLISIGPEAAASVLKQFDDIEIENLCREMAAFPMISETVQKQALDEFAGVVASSVQSATGGIGFVLPGMLRPRTPGKAGSGGGGEPPAAP